METQYESVALVSVIKKGTITHKDREYFIDLKFGKSIQRKEELVYVTYTDRDYYMEWVKRNKAEDLSGKDLIRALIDIEVGDIADRVADAFKLSQILLLSLNDIYSVLSEEQKTLLTKDTVSVFTILNESKAKNEKLFNLDLKEGISSEITKLINRETNVVDILVRRQPATGVGGI